MDLKFIPMKTVFKSSLRGSVDYQGALPKKLTLDRSYVGDRFFGSDRTLFKEVKVMPFEDSLTCKLLPRPTEAHYNSPTELFDHICECLELAVMYTWKPGGVHVIMHSSGIDSRILSATLCHLRKQLGEEWIGQVLFLCSKWEGSEFKKIMEYEGWEPDQYAVPYEDVEKPYYYKDSLEDFKHAWIWNNGASAIPVNLFYWPVLWAIREDRIPHVPDQLYTAQWGNTMSDVNVEGSYDLLRETVKMFYNSILCSRPMLGMEVIHPFTSVELVSAVVSSNIRLGKKLRPMLLEYIDPGLAQFTNMNADGDRHQRIDDGLVKRMVDDYKRSWYGMKIHPEAIPEWKTTEFQDFWYHWSAASFCEYLRQCGYYEIKVE